MALALSRARAVCFADIPLKRIVAGVRVGLLPDGNFIINPTATEMENSALDLLIAGTETAVLMIEGFCDRLPEEQLLEVSLILALPEDYHNIQSCWELGFRQY